MTTFSGRVLPWAARFKTAVPLALAGACLLMFFLGLASRGVRSDDHLRLVLWSMLAGAGAFVGLWVVLLATLARQVIVDERGLRITGRTTLDLGRPRGLRHGRFDRDVAFGRGPLGRRNTTHLWLAVEGERGQTALFVRLLGARAKSDWPAANPPDAGERFDAAPIDLDALRAAIADQLG